MTLLGGEESCVNNDETDALIADEMKLRDN